MSHQIKDHDAVLSVLAIRLLRPATVADCPVGLVSAASSGGYRILDNKDGKFACRKGSATIPPASVPSFLKGVSTGENGVCGWKLKGIEDDDGNPITLLTALNATLGFRVRATK